ncbi:MAG: ribosome maturation factor RimM [Actinomycetes bacterium]
MTAASGGDRPSTVVVGRIGRPHGVHGDVSVEVRTDEPDRRFADGAVLQTDRSDPSQVVVAAHRWHSGRLLVHFDGIDDRTAAATLRGVMLEVPVDLTERSRDPDEFYDHQVIGLTVVDRDGEPLGQVVEVLHGAQDLLVVRRPGVADAMVPFVQELIPEVDLESRRIVADLPEGLLDLGAS